ncbi:NifB/NifX family molybdenum-iron cluster-binding protein [Spirochaetes bacterium]|uniref:NifB/NifX family molybdenum-iron cluster-binding protein n=1 Tax=Candidatus Scatousia excrementipullorum TaxID=2840936 RepID=A0A9D9DQD5_9BACT|nr:NifB/NifX family molybdenum-iron cluster-binding protein [Candidatus Scatousia excrementipullorum]
MMDCSKNFCKNKRGGKRLNAGRKPTCLKKIPFNRRINENILNILKEFAASKNITDTEALESAILLQSNIDKLKGDKIMKIVVPTQDGKLCSHFGHCESFSFAEVNPETKEILSIENKVPDEGISCQSAGWISEQGANVVLAGGMGARPLAIFAQNGLKVVAGCPELPVNEVVQAYLDSTLVTGENACGGEHSHCHGHHHEHGHHHCHHGE